MKKPLVKSNVKVVKNDKMSGYKKGQNREGDQGPVSPFYLNPCFLFYVQYGKKLFSTEFDIRTWNYL